MSYKTLLGIVVLAVAMLSCGDDAQDLKITEISEHEMGIVNSDVQSDGEGLLTGMPEYSQTAAGASETIERAFENAPPMIPHMTDGFFPITKDNNICLTCHMPDKAEEVKAIPLPESHFTNFRPDIVLADGLYKVDAEEGQVVAKDLGNDLSSAFFNCSQCHAPQANVTIDIKNTFEKVFRDVNDKERSDLKSKITEGIN
jgi:cytochrome c-type protein NapB